MLRLEALYGTCRLYSVAMSWAPHRCPDSAKSVGLVHPAVSIASNLFFLL